MLEVQCKRLRVTTKHRSKWHKYLVDESQLFSKGKQSCGRNWRRQKWANENFHPLATEISVNNLLWKIFVHLQSKYEWIFSIRIYCIVSRDIPGVGLSWQIQEILWRIKLSRGAQLNEFHGEILFRYQLCC